ncbi:hypothetical protein [Geodermatophilus sp. CPCC 205506]|uniref:hypothetical protein n=1 Tax=Geodermatophilus sp. CPCC 205506 TaxID=2936596 RepID=UPI003EF01035
MLRSQAGILRALWRGVRHRRDVGPGDVAISYAGRTGPVVPVLAVLGVLEVVVVHVITPWPVVRWLLFGVGVCALVWFAGFVLALAQNPHLLQRDQLVLRFAHSDRIVVPLASLVSAGRRHRGGHRRTTVLEGDRLAVSFMGDTDVELRFDPPVQVAGQPRPVATVAFSADDPVAAVRELRSRVLSA